MERLTDTNEQVRTALMAPEASRQPSDVEFERPDSRWDHDALLEYGTWLCDLLGDDEPAMLNRDILLRASNLGLGPHPKFIREQFGGALSKYYEALGFSGFHGIGRYDDWAEGDFVRYGQQTINHFGRRPTEKELIGLFRSGDGPHPFHITSRFESLGVFFERFGYPDIHSWTHDDYIEWGVDFMLANNGSLPSSRNINELSVIRRGPAARTIANHFETLTAYHELVAAAYDGHQQERQQRLEEIGSQIDSGELPSELLYYHPSQTNIFELAARFELIKQCRFEATEREQLAIAKSATADIFANQLATAGNVTIQDIKDLAADIGLHNDIWPRPRLKYLKIFE